MGSGDGPSYLEQDKSLLPEPEPDPTKSRASEIRAIGIRKTSLGVMPAIQKTTKKRSALSQDGPKGKRVRISKQTAFKHGDETLKKRRQPVTLPIKEIAEDESDDEFGDEESGEDDAEENPAEDEMDADDDAPSTVPNGTLLRSFAVLSF